MDPSEEGFKVVVLDDYQNLVSTLALGTQVPGAEWISIGRHLEGERLVEALTPATAVVLTQSRTAFPVQLFRELPNLELLVTTGMSNPAIDLAAASAQGVTVCGTTSPSDPADSGSGGSYAVELAWGLILSLARNLPGEIQNVRNGGWQRTVGSDLRGCTLGIVGLGRVGSAMAPIGRAFGMDVVAWSPHLDDEQTANVGARLVTKHGLFSTADDVTIHLGLSESFVGTVGEAELRLMKNSAYLINTSRGPLVDADALVRALRMGWIAGAALDVFETEPLPVDSPLRRAPHLIATPHLGYVTHRTLAHWYCQAAEDIASWRSGRAVRVINR